MGLWILTGTIILVFVVVPVILDFIYRKYEIELFGDYNEEGDE